MKDRQRTHDTDPTGLPVDTADTDPSSGEVTEPDDTSPTALADVSSENDTDDFFRWLPTMWVGHRRRKELVERPSSEGADFAAYACEGRPVAATASLRPEAKVQVGTDLSSRFRSLRRESDDRLEPGGRDAPTVLTRRRSYASGRALFGWGAAGLVVMSASILWIAHRPQATELHGGAGASVTFPLPTARTLAERVEPSASPALTAGPQGEAQMASASDAPVAQRAMASAPLVKAVKEARRKGERGALAPVDGSARATASVAAPRVPVKEQYFEEQ